MNVERSGEAGRAVFLSYASQDSEAAKRICEALRAAGVEIWFDQSELVGGDAWDQKIRRQIQECALFVPLVSANTEERHEGYFRLEWDLAEQRTHLMARGLPFLLPVVIDHTNEARAVVPDRFREVQWFKLKGGEPTPDFIACVQRLRSQPRRAQLAAPHSSVSADEADHALPPQAARGRRWTLTTIGLGAVAAVAVAIISVRPSSPDPVATPAMPKTAAHPKSIAVLPFANMSDDRDANAFFADGMHEDILTNLALIRDLRVVSRTTAIQYRDTRKTLRQIGDELTVAYVLVGSVRRAAGKVRVSGQLIRAATDEQVWAGSFDRELTDIFAVQAALATEIGGALQAAISPAERQLIERQPTTNLAAHDAYLQARRIGYSATMSVTTRWEDQERLLEEAVRLDPKFGVAWAELAKVHSFIYNSRDRTLARLAKARAAIARADALEPGSPAVILARVEYYLRCFRDLTLAREQLEKLRQLQPNDPEVYQMLGVVQRRQGNWPASLASLRRAVELDPKFVNGWSVLAALLRRGRRFDEAIAAQRRIVELEPNVLSSSYALAELHFLARGSVRELEQWFAGLTAQQANSAEAMNLKRRWFGAPEVPSDTVRAERATVMRRRLENEPDNDGLWAQLAEVEIGRGNAEEALRAARRAMELMPESQDAWTGPEHTAVYAYVCSRAGDRDRAIAEYARLLQRPGTLNVHEMRLRRLYEPLRDDPRFQALLNDPKNNEPLF